MRYYETVEGKSHGTKEFPFGYYPVDPYYKPSKMVLHWHKEYEINYILEGGMDLTLNNEHYSCQKGDLVFIPGGTLHSAVQHNCTYDCFVFDLEPLTQTYEDAAQFFSDIRDQKISVTPVLSTDDPDIQAAIKQLQCISAGKKSGYKIMIVGTLFYLFGLIREKNFYKYTIQKSSTIQLQLKKLKKTLSYIDENLPYPISLGDLAEIADMNPKYFCGFFKKMTGQTPIEYVNYERLTYASTELVMSDSSITDIALAYGFNDLSYFIRLFKKHFQMSPGQYRKIHRQDSTLNPKKQRDF